jgi:hypothetical protein
MVCLNAMSEVFEVFIPKSLVKLVLKIAEQFEIPGCDEFSILDTLQTSLVKSEIIQKIFEDKMSEKQMCIMILSIIRICEKSNRMHSNLTKMKMDEAFPELGLTNHDFNSEEFEVRTEVAD